VESCKLRSFDFRINEHLPAFICASALCEIEMIRMQRLRPTRRAFTAWLGGTLLSGCATRPPIQFVSHESARRAAVDRAIARTQQFLLARQSPDGAWRSSAYGYFKDGSALTAHVAIALCDTQKTATKNAAEFLICLLSAESANEQASNDLVYPVYTAADASRVLGHAEPSLRTRAAQDRWIGLLRRSQLIEPLGWNPEDLDYGGWGFAPSPPQKPAAGGFHGPWDWSNLSSTVYALEAIASGLEPSPGIFAAASVFVARCQNFGRPTAGNSSVAGDGGFFFAPSEAIRNKAGGSTDHNGVRRFNSYGSMTCDGIRALTILKEQDGLRLTAATRWLEENFSVDHNPGHFVAENEDLRDATYFYYLHSLAEACQAVGSIRAHGNAIEDALIARQLQDGSWVNCFTDGREDDPLVSTPFALRALNTCRELSRR
jgi:hypothetical protein